MEVEKLAEGLWRWTGQVDGRADTSLYLESGGAVVLLDPVLPPEDRERFLHALDHDVARIGGAVHIALTSKANASRAAELAERYTATVWQPDDAGPPPAGLEAVASGRDGVVLFWIPAHATLFSGSEDARIVHGSAS